MRIIEETQLDFSDVLIQPKRSSLNSRKEVDIHRTFTWIDANGIERSFSAIPISVANMGTVGTIQMARELAKNDYMCCLEKHIPADDIISLYKELDELALSEGKSANYYREKVFVSIGVKETLDDIKKINETFPLIGINIDVPNGYIPKLLDRIKDIRNIAPSSFIIAGTVVTSDATQDILNAGAQCVRIGIGQGCFVGNTEILTETGLKKIKDINLGEKVLTHSGKFEEVTNKFTFNDHPEIITVNGITCTPNHKFYVANVSDLDKITEDNYKEYCYWVEAKNLDSETQQLVEISI